MTDPMGPAGPSVEEQYPIAIEFRGRTMRMSKPALVQLSMIARKISRSLGDPASTAEARVALFAQALDVFQSWWQPSDQQWLEDEMLAGRFDVAELAEITTILQDTFGTMEEEAAPKTGPVRARRPRR